jgi:hypothetical protein
VKPLRARDLVLASGFALVFGAGPTVGDTGSCGKTAQEIDEGRFGLARKMLDCQKCTQCSLKTQRCALACDKLAPSDVAFGPTCRPLVHDAEVCLNALGASSCGDYALWVADDVRLVPSECDFCHGVDGSVE